MTVVTVAVVRVMVVGVALVHVAHWLQVSPGPPRTSTLRMRRGAILAVYVFTPNRMGGIVREKIDTSAEPCP